ncbi:MULTISPECIES: hypothetical protein [unclassified Streptomyces]|uniref:hypothetical protein n=1 Tax=unclassified Streptomyces TaxID=2593676 RepID=UPI00342DC7DA
MSRAADELGALLARGGSADGSMPTISAQVDGVTDLGVNLNVGGNLMTDVPCADSYRNRAAGDWVAVRTGARPVVMWRLGADPGDETEADIREIALDAASDLQVVRAVTWGTAAPVGTDWQTTSTLYVRKNAAGKVELYAQLGSVTDPSPGVPPGRAPSPVTVSPTSSGAWRGGRPDETRDHPFQGDYTGRGNLRGGWFYGTAIAAACAGKTVASMAVTFTRARGAGDNAKRPMHLYVHSYTAPPPGQLSLGDGPEELLRLSVGSRGTANLPAAWRTALASGSARGLAIYASGRSDYAAFTGGAIKIMFSA